MADAREPADPNAGAPALVRPLLDGIDALSRLDGWLAATALASLTLLILAEVALRLASSVVPALPHGIPVAWEYGSYLMAATFTFGSAMTLRTGGHIRVSLLLGRLGGRSRRLFEVVLAAVGLTMTGFLAYALARFTFEAYTRGQTSIASATPVWIPQLVVTFGITLFALQFLARLIQALLDLPLEDESRKQATLAE